MWMVLGFPLLWRYFKKGKIFVQLIIGIGYAVTLISGIQMFTVECKAAMYPQLTDFVTQLDAQIIKQYWNMLPEGAQVLDRNPYRSVTLFGRTGGKAYLDNNTPTPEWQNLVAKFDPVKAAWMGYHYIYLDNDWRAEFTPTEVVAFRDACVKRLGKIVDGENSHEFRMLLDIQNCYSGETSP